MFLISFSIMPFRYIFWVTNGRISFFYKAKQYSIGHIYTTFSLSFHLSMDTVFIPWLLQIMLQWTWKYWNFLEMVSFPLDVFSKWNLCNYMLGLLFILNLGVCWASLVAQLVKNLPGRQETCVSFLGWEDPLEKEMATHSSSLVWRIPWTEEPGRLWSMGS